MVNSADFHRLGNWLYNKRVPIVPRVIYIVQFFLFNSSVPVQASLGRGCRFAYGGIGVVIHADCVIGDRCIIGQGVTIGGDGNRIGVPRLGHDVYIGAGARLLGPISIGAGARVGANAVVLSDVPANCTAVGIPARVISA